MLKLAGFLFVCSGALTAGVIQLNQQTIEITETLTPGSNTESAGSGSGFYAYSATFEVPFFYIGTPGAAIRTGISFADILGGLQGCSITGCVESSGVSVTINNNQTYSYGIDEVYNMPNSQYSEVAEDGPDTVPALGSNIATVQINISSDGSAATNPDTVHVDLMETDVTDLNASLSLIPEPSTWALAVTGLTSAIAWRRRRTV